MKRIIALVLLLSACGGGGADTTAAPALVQPQAVPAEAAIAPILLADQPVTGLISFGIAYDPTTLEIAEPRTRFKRNYPEIAWAARLSRGVAASFVTWTVVARSGSGVESTVFSVEEPVDGSDVTALANSGDLALLVDNKAGTYMMRYLDSREVLAEGTFTLVK